jgi:hypothetical protein
MKQPTELRIRIEPHTSPWSGNFSWKVDVTAFDDAGEMETLYSAYNMGLYTEAIETAVQGAIAELENVIEEE